MSLSSSLKKPIRTLQTNFPELIDAKFAVQREMRRRLRYPHERDFKALRNLPVAPNQLFLDVGSNRGQSIDSIRLYGEEREIQAFEPNPILCDRLKALFADMPGVRIRNFGLGDADRTLPLHVPYYRGFMFDSLGSFDEEHATWWLRNGALYGFRPELLRVEPVICKTKRLDDLNLAPFFIKLDVQGFEFPALVGGEQTIAQYRPILLVEVPKQPEINLLRRHGYDIYRYARGRFIKGQRGAPNSFFLTPDKAELVADRIKAV